MFNVAWCFLCHNFPYLQADDQAMHLTKKHNWSCKQAEGWLLVEVEKEYKHD